MSFTLVIFWSTDINWSFCDHYPKRGVSENLFTLSKEWCLLSKSLRLLPMSDPEGGLVMTGCDCPMCVSLWKLSRVRKCRVWLISFNMVIYNSISFFLKVSYIYSTILYDWVKLIVHIYHIYFWIHLLTNAYVGSIIWQ